MRLEGSCHCRAVQFSVESHGPVPFMHCHCSICRKTAGGGGSAINLGADAPEVVEAALAFAANWVDVPAGRGHVCAQEWPDESLDDWHRRHGLWSD
jgi:hypothetical protein